MSESISIGQLAERYMSPAESVDSAISRSDHRRKSDSFEGQSLAELEMGKSDGSPQLLGADQQRHRHLEFDIQARSNRIVIKIVDTETGEIIRRIPPEEIKQVTGHIEGILGIVIDEKV